MSVVLEYLEQRTSESGEAADTGSAVGRAVELWHRSGGTMSMGAALAQTFNEASEQFPKANRKKVSLISSQYASDPRNAHDRIIKRSLEQEFLLRTPIAKSAKSDAATTGRTGDIVIIGHCDQMRIPIGYKDEASAPHLEMWDLKCSRFEGADLIYNYAWQLAIYAVAATRAYGKPVIPAGIIRVSAYDVETADNPESANVFFGCPWGLETAEQMFLMLQKQILRLRKGDVPHINPGDKCRWCVANNPSNCINWWGDQSKKERSDPVEAAMLIPDVLSMPELPSW